MSQTVPSLVPVLVVDAAEDVEVELSGDGALVDESAEEVPDSTGTVVISGWVMLPKPDTPPPPPHETALARAKTVETRMEGMILAKVRMDVTDREEGIERCYLRPN